MMWLASLSVSCGGVAFKTVADQQEERGVSDIVVATTLDNRSVIQNLTWHFPCDESEEAEDSEYDFVGQGRHKEDMGGVRLLKLEVSGVMCNIRYFPRDVVFVIDTSASMETNDPVDADGTCGRLRAMDRMANYLADFKKARVGLVTYNSSVEVLRPYLIAAPDFYAEYISERERMKTLLCQADTYTNYYHALKKTEKLLSTGRKNSFKEVYFFSDGEPRESLFYIGKDPAGLDIAEKIRKTAVIATIGLGKTGILEEDIASKIAGAPLHRQAEEVDELFYLLRELVQTENIGADLSYRYLDTETKYTINVWEEVDFDVTDFFQLEPLLFTIDRDDPEKSAGIEVEIRYWDNNDNGYHARGALGFDFP